LAKSGFVKIIGDTRKRNRTCVSLCDERDATANFAMQSAAPLFDPDKPGSIGARGRAADARIEAEKGAEAPEYGSANRIYSPAG
jgi:hypothetical protein